MFSNFLSRSNSLAVLATIALLVAAGCSDDQAEEAFPLIDAASSEDDAAADADRPLPDEIAVPIELDDYISTERTDERASLYKVESADQLADGPAVEARVGDWVLENDKVRLFVQGLDRAMSPCPWGGNIVDAQYKRADGSVTEDVTGETCLMINVGQTLAPERFDVVRDGSDGGPAILAVSGDLQLIDFLNIGVMAADYAPGILEDLGLDPDKIIPAKLTRYMILHPGSNGVKVVTALRYEGDETVEEDEEDIAHMTTGHLMRGGAHGHYFNPSSSLKGWGYTSLGPSNVEGDPLPFIAYSGPKGGYAYVPTPDPRLEDDPNAMPVAGAQVAVSGVAVSLLGRSSVLNTLLAQENQLAAMEGLLHLEKDEVALIEHWEFFGDGKLSTMVDEIYPTLGMHTASVDGRVTDADGRPVSDARVTAINGDDRALNQTRTDADGRYEMRVPPGAYRFKARKGPRISQTEPNQLLGARDEARANLRLKDSAHVNVTIRTPDDEPTPARISVICEGECPDMPTSQEEDVTLDSLPGGFARVVSTDVDGQASIELAAGSYRLAVSRGMEWSIWPNDAPETGGHLVELDEGDTVELDAEIARVVDTSGALSADFHVHGVTSPDSVVRKANRVRDFMGEGVDVLISTDHDFISDYGPEVARLGAGDQIASVVGVEMTTPGFGHFNAFPLERDPEHRRGGALDWARGTDWDMTPGEMFAWVDEQDGDPDNAQVKQINHPRTTIGPIKPDLVRGISLGERDNKRVEPADPDPDTGDTGLWSEDFTAIEVMNGHSMGRFRGIMRWWLTMVSRGFSPTATAVTDTHRLYSDLGGSPRSFVFVGDDHDTIDTFDEQALAQASNQNRVVGSNGPFFRVELENTDGATAGLGETLESTDGEVTVRVSIDTPEWIRVDTVDIYSNLAADDIVTAPGRANEDPLAPTSSHTIDWEEADLVEAANNIQAHRHYTKTLDIPMTIEEDAYVVVIVRASDGDSGMWPVVRNGNVQPFAFANPIFVDADGGGYDNPPFKELADSPIEPTMLREAIDEPFEGEVTPEVIEGFFERFSHDHDH